MFKVSRVPQNESYNITSDWVSDFANNLKKQARSVEDYKPNHVEKFSTINEKMQDMKSRVGFEDMKTLKKSSSALLPCGCEESCGCATPKGCSCNEEGCDYCGTKNTLRDVLNYAKELIEKTDGITVMQAKHNCRQLPQFSKIEGKFKSKEFDKFLQDMISKKPQQKMTIEFADPQEIAQFDILDDMKAPYIK